MQRVKEMMAAGVGVTTAIKEAIGMNVTAFADKHDLSRTLTSDVINLERFPRPAICLALSTELDGDPFDWAVLLWEAGKPERETFNASLFRAA